SGGEAEAHHHASHAPAKPRPCVPTPGDTGGYGIGQRRPTANEEKASRSDDVEARRASAAMRSTHAQWVVEGPDVVAELGEGNALGVVKFGLHGGVVTGRPGLREQEAPVALVARVARCAYRVGERTRRRSRR